VAVFDSAKKHQHVAFDMSRCKNDCLVVYNIFEVRFDVFENQVEVLLVCNDLKELRK